MRRGKSTEELIEKLVPVIEDVRNNKAKMKILESGLEKNYIRYGRIRKYFLNPKEELSQIDPRELLLITKQLNVIKPDPEVHYSAFFTDKEIESAELFNPTINDEPDMDFPLTLNNFMQVSANVYIGVLDIKEISKIYTNRLLRYNFDYQREASHVQRANGTIEKVPKLNVNSVKDIAKETLNGTLSTTTLTWNALAFSSEDGEEITFTPSKMRLTINKGTRLDILDGMHRINGIVDALHENPNLEHNMTIMITNFDTAEAQKHLAQISKINEISREHIKSLEKTRLSDFVVDQINKKSDLKDRIATGKTPNIAHKELTTFNILSSVIEEEFTIMTKIEAKDISEELIAFFDYLVDAFPEEFITNYQETYKESAINDPNMFAGYIVLAKRMRNEGIKYRKVKDILSNIDFKLDNPMWTDFGILNKNGTRKSPTIKTRDAIKKFFNNIEVVEGETIS
ncbi:DNA sulfur modification protein DndB [Priestia sp. SB1]|uniref:DNA sulfur modification protein DndB n=1 Tax=Priestia sp. SB1 TaxID=3132359 RepID=UPI0031766DE6